MYRGSWKIYRYSTQCTHLYPVSQEGEGLFMSCGCFVEEDSCVVLDRLKDPAFIRPCVLMPWLTTGLGFSDDDRMDGDGDDCWPGPGEFWSLSPALALLFIPPADFSEIIPFLSPWAGSPDSKSESLRAFSSSSARCISV